MSAQRRRARARPLSPRELASPSGQRVGDIAASFTAAAAQLTIPADIAGAMWNGQCDRRPLPVGLLDRLRMERETPWVLVAGTSQRRLARVLNAAYANGLLSQDTFVRRTDQLLGGGVIDPVRLVGDLNFRRSRSPVSAALAGLIDRVVHAFEPERAPVHPLLALDWSGAQSQLLIGRHHGCDLVLSDLSVSRRHVRLVFRDGRWILQDLESTNGTIVNGCRVGRSELRPGDHLALGEAHLTID